MNRLRAKFTQQKQEKENIEIGMKADDLNALIKMEKYSEKVLVDLILAVLCFCFKKIVLSAVCETEYRLVSQILLLQVPRLLKDFGPSVRNILASKWLSY